VVLALAKVVLVLAESVFAAYAQQARHDPDTPANLRI
jgi:hypothetical protein